MKKILLGLLLVAAASSQAETRYITDQFKITMRSGESSGHRIVQMVKSGTPVTVLSHNKATGYSHVRLASGKDGYVLTRQLLKEPVARDQLATLEARIQVLESAPGELSSKLASLSKEHDELKVAHSALLAEKNTIEEELAALRHTSANAVQIAKERTTLRKQAATMTRELEDQKQEIRELKNNSNQRWFLIGGGVIVGGILIGLILPHLRVRKRRDTWGSL